MEEQQTIPDIGGIIRRRYKGFLIIFCLIFPVAAVVAFALPPVFQSQTTILVEGQQIPSEYLRTTVTSFIEERLEIIYQQVMSRTRLLEVINKYDLYTDMRERLTTEEIIEKMRKDISIKTISANVKDPSGRTGMATIAFTLTYEGRTPSTVQKVANVLASLYLEENLKTRSKRATTTVEFFQHELDSISNEIDQYEERISRFKEEHMGELPEHTQVNLQTIERLTHDLDQIELQINALQERQVYLQGQLSTVQPNVIVGGSSGGGGGDPMAQRLEAMRLALAAMMANRSEKHPDVIRLKNEIRELESQLEAGGGSFTVADKASQLEQAQADLASLQSRYGPKHPDVLRKQREVEALTKEVAEARRNAPSSNNTPRSTARSVSNPAYFSLKTQIDAAALEIKNLMEERITIRKKVVEYQDRLERAPMVEKDYSRLLRDYGTARSRYDQIMTKLMEAKAAQGMEETQKGERFTIVEPAHRPQKPYKPNRTAIVLIGLVISMGAGAGFAALRETLDSSIKTAGELAAVTGLPLLAAMPLMVTAEQVRKKRILTVSLVLGAILAVGGCLVVIHLFIMPLDMLWIKIQRRVMLWS